MAHIQFSDAVEKWSGVESKSPVSWADLPSLPEEFDYGFRNDPAFDVVCAQCVHDEALRRFAVILEPARPCDFCGDSEQTQSSVDALFEYVYRSLLREYEDPAGSHLIFDKEEDNWFGVDVLDTSDLLGDLGSPLGDGTRLHALFCRAIEHDWYRIDTEVGSMEQRLIWSWQSFKDRIQAGPRFLFDADAAEFGGFSVADLFSYFDTCAAHLQQGLVKIEAPGLVLARARPTDSRVFSEPEDLGPATARSGEGTAHEFGRCLGILRQRRCRDRRPRNATKPGGDHDGGPMAVDTADTRAGPRRTDTTPISI